jgi:thiol-disulfide isomerase/thioredoxin
LISGKPSPVFDYENHKGGKTSLESLKGSYVYVDVWATWCGPCRQEIPLLKVEQQFEGKNIKFVSISVDTQKTMRNGPRWLPIKTSAASSYLQTTIEFAIR